MTVTSILDFETTVSGRPILFKNSYFPDIEYCLKQNILTVPQSGTGSMKQKRKTIATEGRT